jgi:uncharacterized membrane protein YgcG
MELLFNGLLLLVFAIVTWCVAGEGAWGAGIILLCVVFSGLLAMNFFESLAVALDDILPAGYADIVALCGLFIAFVSLLRVATEHIAPIEIELPAPVYQAGRWVFAAITGYTTMAFLLTALHTAPVPREFAGFKPERKNLLNMAAPDRQWLGFVQYVSEHGLRHSVSGRRRVFDGLEFRRPGRPDDTLWAAFPIRYATRRELITGAAAGSSSANTLSAGGSSSDGGGGGGAGRGGGF